MTRRPRGVDSRWFFHLPREYRREHMRCCVDTSYCPVCGAVDANCTDLCGCFAKAPEVWRNAEWARQVAADPSLADPPPDQPAAGAP